MSIIKIVFVAIVCVPIIVILLRELRNGVTKGRVAAHFLMPGATKDLVIEKSVNAKLFWIVLGAYAVVILVAVMVLVRAIIF